MNKENALRYLSMLLRERVEVTNEYNRDIEKYSTQIKPYRNTNTEEYLDILNDDIKTMKKLLTNEKITNYFKRGETNDRN